MPFQAHCCLFGNSRHGEFFGNTARATTHLHVRGIALVGCVDSVISLSSARVARSDNSPACTCVDVVTHEFVMGGHFDQDTELQLARVVVFSCCSTSVSLRIMANWEPSVEELAKLATLKDVAQLVAMQQMYLLHCSLHWVRQEMSIRVSSS